MEKTSRESFLKQIGFSNSHQSYRDCPYYPCHALPAGQDHLNCLLCYCPFYPCGNSVGTGRWTSGGRTGKIWDCTECSFIHRDDVAARILELFLTGWPAARIRRQIRREFSIQENP